MPAIGMSSKYYVEINGQRVKGAAVQQLESQLSKVLGEVAAINIKGTTNIIIDCHGQSFTWSDASEGRPLKLRRHPAANVTASWVILIKPAVEECHSSRNWCEIQAKLKNKNLSNIFIVIFMTQYIWTYLLDYNISMNRFFIKWCHHQFFNKRIS